MTPVETILVETHTVACDGGGDALGHPTVYLTLDGKTHEVTCPYCSRHYILSEHSHAHAAHG